MKAVLETTPAVRDRAKVLAAQNRVSIKQLTTLVMDRGLAALEAGSLTIKETTRGLEETPTPKRRKSA